MPKYLHFMTDGKCRYCGAGMFDPESTCPELERRAMAWKAKQKARIWTPERAVNIFSYRPRKGDEWTLKLPGKNKIRKTVDKVTWEWVRLPDGRNVKRNYVDWKRLSKGRYSGAFVKNLLRYGMLIEREPMA